MFLLWKCHDVCRQCSICKVSGMWLHCGDCRGTGLDGVKVDGIQLMRTYEVVLRYSAINRLKDAIAREICRHWLAPDGRCEVASIRRYTGFLLPVSKSMKLRRGNTEIEDHLANRAFVLPELSQKIPSKDKLIPGNALATIRNLLEPDYSTI